MIPIRLRVRMGALTHRTDHAILWNCVVTLPCVPHVGDAIEVNDLVHHVAAVVYLPAGQGTEAHPSVTLVMEDEFPESALRDPWYKVSA